MPLQLQKWTTCLLRVEFCPGDMWTDFISDNFFFVLNFAAVEITVLKSRKETFRRYLVLSMTDVACPQHQRGALFGDLGRTLNTVIGVGQLDHKCSTIVAGLSVPRLEFPPIFELLLLLQLGPFPGLKLLVVHRTCHRLYF